MGHGSVRMAKQYVAFAKETIIIILITRDDIKYSYIIIKPIGRTIA